MKYIKIIYADAELEIPEFLKTLWPYGMLLKDWPTFCGAGSGLGDWIVPDKINHKIISPGCFIHDLDWAIADGSKQAWTESNHRFCRNIKNLVKAQIIDQDLLESAFEDCEVYRIMVSSPIGWMNYDPCGTDPWTNPVVKDRLRRLALKNIKVSQSCCSIN